MKKWLVSGMFTLVLIAVIALPAQASYDHLFVNHCDADISVDFYTHTLLCKDHHSGSIPPGKNWSCSTNCPWGDSVTINYRGVRYPQTGSPGTQGTHGVHCTKQPDGSYKVNMVSE
jgi:hypothetical protein